jgi:hypothetical protein
VSRTVLLQLALGCAGPDDSTLLDELQVVATLAEPPELGAGESTELETWLVDPEGRGHEALQWTCTVASEGCLEAELGWEVLRTDRARFENRATLSPALAELLGEEPLPLMAVWTLACEPGLCPLMEAEGEDLAEGLTRPTELLEELPLFGVSLAVRWLYASAREDKQGNPGLSCELDSGIEPGAEVLVRCEVEGSFGEEARIWGYATAGGWSAQSVELSEAEDLTWLAPEEAASAELFLVLVDGLGGQALWEARVEVP